MGFFTWTLANRKPVLLKNGDYAARCKLRYGGYGAVVCPDGTLIQEPTYEGYGVFDGKDVYELVLDWNRDYLKDILRRPEFTRPDADDTVIKTIIGAYASDDPVALRDAVDTATKTAKYLATDWKRCAGIHIACGRQNAMLPYPIKIVDRPVRTPYEKLRPSESTQ